MKYMLMMFGDAATMLEERSPEWVSGMFAFMTTFNGEVEKTAEQVGELGAQLLGGNALEPTMTATSIRGDVVTDGPFAETKEALAGYWVFDVENEARALELAAQVVVWGERIELREVPDGPPEQ
jgi:hypothetical protein